MSERRDVQLDYKKLSSKRLVSEWRWSPYRVGIFLAAMMAAIALIVFAALNAVVRGF